MIILGKPESDHLDWSQHRLYINNDTGFIDEMQSYSYDKCNQMVFDLVKEKMEAFEGGFDARKQFNKKWPTAPLA